MINRVFTLLPYVVSLLTLANGIVSYQFQIRPYIWLAIFSIFLFAVKWCFSGRRRRTTTELVALGSYVILVGCLLLIQYTINSLSVKSCFVLTWAPVFWLIFVHAMPDFDWSRFTRFIIFLGVVVAALGFIQRFVSSNLFGLIEDIKWSHYFEMNREQIRVHSLLDSPQVYGLFSAICFALALNVQSSFPFLWRYTPAIIILTGALLSGNKSASILVVISLFYKLKIPAKPLILFLIFVSLIIYGTLRPPGQFVEPDNSSKLYVIERSFQWLVDLPGLLVKEQEGRLRVYRDIIVTSNPIWGHGMGSTASYGGYREITPESYLLQIYSEAGLLAVLLMLCFFILAMRLAKRNGDRVRLLILGLILFASFFVHAFTAPIFFAIWGLMLGGTLGQGGRMRYLVGLHRGSRSN